MGCRDVASAIMHNIRAVHAPAIGPYPPGCECAHKHGNLMAVQLLFRAMDNQARESLMWYGYNHVWVPKNYPIPKISSWDNTTRSNLTRRILRNMIGNILASAFKSMWQGACQACRTFTPVYHTICEHGCNHFMAYQQ